MRRLLTTLSAWLHLLLLWQVQVRADDACPKECQCFGTSVDCSGQALDRIPHDLPEDTTDLNLSGNDLVAVTDQDGLSRLRQLRAVDLSHNDIACVEDGALWGLQNLRYIDLRSNALSSVPADLSRYDLRFDVSGNRLECDCALAAAVANATQGQYFGEDCVDEDADKDDDDGEMVDLASKLLALRCNDASSAWSPSQSKSRDCASLVSSANAAAEWSCPKQCSCFDGIADCRNKKIRNFPRRFPKDITEIRLDMNDLKEIPENAFVGYKRLRRIDISSNEITRIGKNAFRGLKSLTSLVMYSNKISSLHPSIFTGLTSLQLLLLNSNKINCIHKDTFKDLHSVSLLSLYDNHIQSLDNGTFNGLTKLQTLHLARNPFYCDCKLSWMLTWLRANPVETSGVRCDAPKRYHKRKIVSIANSQLPCYKDVKSPLSQCWDEVNCPAQCKCLNGTVDCSGLNLREIPQDIPQSTVRLLLSGNQISRVSADGLFNRLPRLTHLDLGRNSITDIEEGAFEGANSLKEIILSQNSISRMNNRILRGLTNVESLDLFSNEIGCITPGAFDALRSLRSLNLISNSINCNCHMGWFAEWITAKGFHKNGPRCAQPENLRNRPLHLLSSHDFQCKGENDMGCLGEHYCPPSCSCTGTIVRCSHANLKEIPEGIPRETSELYLDVNKISSIDTGRIKHLKALSRLDLSNNEISVLPPYVFANLTRLSTLIVSYNKLQCVQENAFYGLDSLRILSLHGNEISRIPESAFDVRSSVTHLALGSNPFHCDCSLKWLSAWIKRDYIEPGIAKCHSPAPLKDKLILTTPSEDFKCIGEVDVSILAKCNLCHHHPCKNGAKCSPLPNRDYQCECTPGFYGKNCDATIDACYGNPCVNGAECSVVEAGRFECNCRPGFVGVRCEQNVDDCKHHECRNNATCVDGVQEYHCQCQDGYTGQYCESRIPLCPADGNPCLNGGRCVDHATHYTCECAEGFRGNNCAENIDDCENNLCQNGGTCVDGINSYTCQCPSEFAGKYCEIEPMVAQLYPQQTSPCQHHDCVHGICFQPPDRADKNEYVCKCAAGYSGKKCEYLTSLSFSTNNSYVEMEPLSVKPAANITIEFATTQDNGILLYTGESQHLAVELFRGRIRVSYDVGNYPVSTMFSYELVADGKFHQIELLAVRKNFTLRVDGGLARSIVNEGKNDFLNVRRPLFIAGAPEDEGISAIKQWHLRNITSFRGCMNKVVINGKVVDFLQAATVRNKVSPGCSSYQQEEPTRSKMLPPDPCERRPCKHGSCRRTDPEGPDAGPPGFRCTCQAGYTGNRCDIRDSPQRDRGSVDGEGRRRKGRRNGRKKKRKCRKQRFRDYFIEADGCRSKRPYNMTKCIGVGKNVCLGKKVKQRMIRFVCDDGRQYKKEVEIIKKCGRMHG